MDAIVKNIQSARRTSPLVEESTSSIILLLYINVGSGNIKTSHYIHDRLSRGRQDDSGHYQEAYGYHLHR
jgi:hypothetical protein